MRLLVIHGPNMNLYGVRSSKKGDTITLDKINRHIRQSIRDKDIDLKIMQSHDEVKIVSYLHRNRNKFDGVILVPGIWQKCGHILSDTISLFELKYLTIHIDKGQSKQLFKGEKIIYNDNIYDSFTEAIDFYANL
tara:strand:+ start:297 stop:701 length:405 start_codon:yes stop_codon:yes gene_type:complete